MRYMKAPAKRLALTSSSAPVPSLRLRLIRSPALASDAVIGFIAAGSVLDRKRKLLGYIDVAALKAKWEAGQADPVSLVSYPALGQTLY